MYIDQNDILYSTDSSSNSRTNPGWQRGIYIGSARTGEVSGFILDPEPDPESNPVSGAYGVAGEAIAVHPAGNIYATEGPASRPVVDRAVTKYLP